MRDLAESLLELLVNSEEAKASSINIKLTLDSTIKLELKDDGCSTS
jgi:hypothetical protein